MKWLADGWGLGRDFKCPAAAVWIPLYHYFSWVLLQWCRTFYPVRCTSLLPELPTIWLCCPRHLHMASSPAYYSYSSSCLPFASTMLVWSVYAPFIVNSDIRHALQYPSLMNVLIQKCLYQTGVNTKCYPVHYREQKHGRWRVSDDCTTQARWEHISPQRLAMDWGSSNLYFFTNNVTLLLIT